MAKCKTCGATDAEADFYASINTYCKEHWRERVKANRQENIDHYRELDRARANLPHRVAARAEYQKTDAYAESHAKSVLKYRQENPERRAAHVALGHAVRDGRVVPAPCLICGQKAEAHHPDYSRPLDVVWLCSLHHKQAHALAREIESELEAA